MRMFIPQNLIFAPRCGGEFVYTNLVDTTNGSYDNEGNRIDGALTFPYRRIIFWINNLATLAFLFQYLRKPRII